MRLAYFLISLIFSILLIFTLNSQLGSIPPIGKFLSPQHGFWQNAESCNWNFNMDLRIPELKNKAEVYFDERLVPHIFARNESDAFFVQGYLHAKFRLWQMDFQTRAASGRLSEILGPGKDDVLITFDRNMRRLGMVYAAEIAAEESKKDSSTKLAIQSYSDGVNYYIDHLKESELPLEFKLLNYHPEKWSFLKTALFLKYMSLDLTGHEDDFEMTNARSLFSESDFDKIYPIIQDSLDPIVPKGTVFPAAGLKVKKPALADSLYFTWKDSNAIAIKELVPNKDNGSNNWAVSGSKTKSGRPILCNDPHLGLNLPSLWYEMQIHTPDYNAYGASFPGAPCIIIGFNDSCAWGFTNASRDVRDYYEVTFIDNARKQYWYDNDWQNTSWRIDTIRVKGRSPIIDSVAYTVFGPVMYDKTYTGMGRITGKKNYAVRWKAHDPSNELKLFYGLNRTRNYNDYYEAIKNLHTPGQNCIFASKNGDIAIWDQGEFPAKWKRQGDFVMPGSDSSFLWQGMIPQAENPHLINPERGFVSSANQLPADTTYPYYLGGSYPNYRGLIINRFLRNMSGVTPQDMQKLQTENYNVFAEMARPLLLKNIRVSELDSNDKKFLEIFRKWNLRNDPYERGITVFSIFYSNLESEVWDDELHQKNIPVKTPEASTLLENLLKDSNFKFIDNINTPQKETLQDVVTAAFKKSVRELKELEQQNRLVWYKYKDAGIRHLLRQEALSRYHLVVGGGTSIINATTDFHGPSWRMIVHLTDETEAYAVYPGGQSGNPGSKYYDSFINTWAEGKYYRLWIMKPGEQNNKRIISKMSFSK